MRTAHSRGFVQTLLLVFTSVVVLGLGGYFYSLPKDTPDTSVTPITSDTSLPAQSRNETENTEPVSVPQKAEAPKTTAKTVPVSVAQNTQNTEPPKAPATNVPVATSNQKTACPDPFIFDLPIEIGKATSVLYPGQIRGGEFKAHGGFRFDTSRPDEITVVAPIDAAVVTGARYPVAGEIQYTLEFEDPCGIRYRLGHLLTLAPKFQAIAEKFPMPTTLDSRTTQVYPPIAVKKGEIIATAVGLTGRGEGGTGKVNTFLDWGVYDLRQKNEASQDPAWAASHTSETYQYGVCWFDWISPENRVKVLSLPSSDGEHGTQSDFCR